MDRSRISKITPNTAENAMPVSTRRKYESLGAALSRVEEEARGIGKVQTTVAKVVGAGDILQEVGTRTTAVGTPMEVLGLVEEALGEPGGAMPRLQAVFGQSLSKRDQKLVKVVAKQLILHEVQTPQMTKTVTSAQSVQTKKDDQSSYRRTSCRLFTTSGEKALVLC